jgi:transcription antitermination protein NusB
MSTKSNINFQEIRRTGRVLAFQTLFAFDFGEKPIEELLKFDWLEEKYPEHSMEYAISLIKGTIANLEVIDDKIKKKLKNWDFERISGVDKAVLRFSIYSMLYENDVPEKVIINEAVEIVKKFGADDSYKFVNGILDAVKRSKKAS